jgi:hypothetical protein
MRSPPSTSSPTDAVTVGPKRVIRGGSWNSNAHNVRAANRNWNEPGNRNDNIGFRLARAQTWAGSPTPDPTVVPSRPPAGGPGECRGRRCASRASVPNAHRRPSLRFGARAP